MRCSLSRMSLAPFVWRNSRYGGTGTLTIATLRDVVRGILCGYCNRAIGCAKENPKALRAMADYLEDSRL